MILTASAVKAFFITLITSFEYCAARWDKRKTVSWKWESSVYTSDQSVHKVAAVNDSIYVVNVPRFQSCHFFGYQSFAQSRVAQTSHKRCSDCSLRQSPISFAHKAFWCKIRSQKPANSACVNLSRQISAQSESNLTPDCLCSLVRFPQIFQSFTLTKLDRLSTVDLHTWLYRTSNKLSSG